MKNFWTQIVLKKIIIFTLPALALLMVTIYKRAYLMLPFILPIIVVCLALPLIDVMTHFFPDFYYPTSNRKKPKPTFSMVRSLKKAHKFDEALTELRRMADLNPQEVDIWLELLEIALIDLKDVKQGELLFREAHSILENESKRQLVQRFYENIVG